MTVLRFTKDHEWVRLDGTIATVGIANHAQEAIGDIVFVELPDVGRTVNESEACAVVESIKAASDIFAPIAGTIVARNEVILRDPALVNRDPMDKGWFFKMKLADNSAIEALMDETAYSDMVNISVEKR